MGRIELPHDRNAERAVLGSILMNAETMSDALSELGFDVRVFYDRRNSIIYQALLTLYKAETPIDLITLQAEIDNRHELEGIGGIEYLSFLVESVEISSHILEYCKIVKSKFVLRETIKYGKRLIDTAYSPDVDLSGMLSDAGTDVQNISLYNVGEKEYISIEDLSENSKKLMDNPTIVRQHLKFGYPRLDAITYGPKKGDYIIIAARPSIGKTTLAINMAINMAKQLIDNKKYIYIFSFEMTNEELYRRILSAETKIPLNKLRWDNMEGMLTKSDAERISAAIERIKRLPIIFDTLFTNTIDEIAAKCKKLKQDKGLGAIIIDYIQLISEKRHGKVESRQQEISQISRKIKLMAKSLAVPIIVLSQLSRDIEKRGGKGSKRPLLSDLRDSGCVTGDTLIQRIDTGESIPIKDMVGAQLPIPTMSLDKNFKFKKSNIINVFSSGKKQIYELKTMSGRTVKASANHPFLKLNGWTRLDNLKVGDRIATPRYLAEPENPTILKKEEYILMGHLLGDGCILPSHAYQYTSGDMELLDIVRECAKKLFNIDGKLVKQKNWWHYFFACPYRLTHGKYHPITNWFNKLKIQRCRSYEKVIPEAIMQSSNSNIALFLKHLWSTDGTINMSANECRISYSTTSSKMAIQVQHLLLRFGILSTIFCVKKESYRINFMLSICGKENQMKFLNNIGIAGKKNKKAIGAKLYLNNIVPNPNTDIIPKDIWNEIKIMKNTIGMSWRKFAEKLNVKYNGTAIQRTGISRKRMLKIFGILPKQRIEDLAVSDIYWDKIRSITPLGIEETYDITVEGTHNFIAGGMCLKNSLEQDSDVVLFLHKTNKDAEDNEVELIVGKQRNGNVGIVPLIFKKEISKFVEEVAEPAYSRDFV